MTDFERFAEYWEQAVNGLAYRLDKEGAPVLTRTQVQAIWRDELLTKRFFSTGVKHGAAVFLDELKEARPETADAVIRCLAASEMPFGMDGASAADAGLAAAGLVGACAPKLNLVARVASLLVGGAFAVKTAKHAAHATKGVLQEALEQEAAEQLRGYKALLEAAR